MQRIFNFHIYLYRYIFTIENGKKCPDKCELSMYLKKKTKKENAKKMQRIWAYLLHNSKAHLRFYAVEFV